LYKPLTHDEATKIRPRIVEFIKGKGIDIGCGPDKVLPKKAQNASTSCIGIDKFCNEADVMSDGSDLGLFADDVFDYVFSSHVLEDYTYWQGVVKEWYRVVKPGGYLILYLPLTRRIAREMGLENWQDFYPNIEDADEERNLDHRTDFNPQDVKDYILSLAPAKLVVDEIRNTKDDYEYSFLLVFNKLGSMGLPALKPKPNGKDVKKAVIVRYGAFGDAIMTTPIPRILSEQGYEVHMNCTDYSMPVYQNNPYIKKFLVQPKDACPANELPDEWKELEKRYDKVINLCGAIEGSMLVRDNDAFNTMWNIRQKVDNTASDRDIFLEVVKVYQKQFGRKNYYDAHLEKAGLSERGLSGELYFTEIEERMMHDFLRSNRGRFIVLWSLSGSALHKVYPYFHQAVQKILSDIPEALVISVGDAVCRIMEPPPSGRYLPRSGDWSMRMSMLMTKYADLVVGPETGILNAAGCYETPKIVMRSHSSHDNLCKYWKNDFCLEPDPERVPCSPCHMLHYSEDTCLTGELMNSAPAKQMKKEEKFCAPICVSWGVPPDKLVARVQEVRDKFPLRNPRPKREMASSPALSSGLLANPA